MQAEMAELSVNDTAMLPYRIRDIAIDVGLLMVAATFILLGGTGLVGHVAGIAYPLSGLMVSDAALTGLLAGCCLLGWLTHYRKLSVVAALNRPGSTGDSRKLFMQCKVFDSYGCKGYACADQVIILHS